jgi:3-hydroxyisobutyrate dehydrogenase-like beta-hydroxyacid dehydrogenase
MVIGLLHPGEMGSALGRLLHGRGHDVAWASAGRSAATAARAREAGLRDAGSLSELVGVSDLILSICPPHAAVEVAESIAGFGGLYLDANAIAPATARRAAAIVEGGGARFVDGGVIGPPPSRPDTTRLYLSGTEAPAVAEIFAGALETPIVENASALKMAYAAWTKGTFALLLAIRALARAEGVEAPLDAEWDRSQPGLRQRSADAAGAAAEKGWRWIGEMEEIAGTMAGAGLPPGFHEAAAEIYRRSGAA